MKKLKTTNDVDKLYKSITGNPIYSRYGKHPKMSYMLWLKNKGLSLTKELEELKNE